MLTVVLGLLSSFSYAVSDMASQHVARAAGSVVRVMFVVLVTGVSLSVPALLITEGGAWHGGGWGGVAWAAVAGVLYVAAYFCLLAGFKRGDLSLVAALSSSQGAFVVLFAALGGERIGPVMGLGLALAVAGGVATAIQGRARTAHGAAWALASGLLFGLVMAAYDRADGLSWLATATVSRVVSFTIFVPVLAAVLLAGRRRAGAPVMGATAADPPGRFLPTRRLLGVAIAAGVLEMLGLVLVSASIRSGPLSVAGVMASQFATFAVMLGIVFLHERPRWWQLVGIGATIAGVSILGAMAGA